MYWWLVSTCKASVVFVLYDWRCHPCEQATRRWHTVKAMAHNGKPTCTPISLIRCSVLTGFSPVRAHQSRLECADAEPQATRKRYCIERCNQQQKTRTGRGYQVKRLWFGGSRAMAAFYVHRPASSHNREIEYLFRSSVTATSRTRLIYMKMRLI